MKKKVLFLTNRESLNSKVTGGVQLCSQEFHHILDSIPEFELEDYFVPFTRNIFQRLRIKLGMENYSMYDTGRDSPALIEYIRKQQISIVFINMASLVRYARPIRQAMGDRVKIILLSHGNHSGDFLHLITKPVKKTSTFRQTLNKIRLGSLISTEAEYRVKYLDGVVALSETEKQIENWFGSPKVAFLPRRIYADFLDYKPITGRIGFVGRLDHPPNLQGISILLEQIKKLDHRELKIRLVGAPESCGRELQIQFPFLEYLGELSDKDLEAEVSGWSLVLNPVWWYSTGASTKLARVISWGIPIITTTAGMRGYEWEKGELLVADTPQEMANTIVRVANEPSLIQNWANQTRVIAENGPSMEGLASKIRSVCQ